MLAILQLLLVPTCALALGNPSSVGKLPIVDIGYGRYQAANITDTTYYTFSNIRYAANPSFSLRWKAPRPPPSTVPSSEPAQPSTEYAHKPDLHALLDPGPLLLNDSQPTPAVDPRIDEDCLLLDVYTPKRVLDGNRQNVRKAPVLFWIHGGGYVTGSKDRFATPAGFYNVSSEDFVFVSINYRLNTFGFLAGSQVRQHGDLNVGLLDQRMALQWVKEHIAQFGGDPSRVTIMGESAGGGSTMFHVTAFGGKGDQLFHQVISQSPAWLPIDMLSQEKSLEAFFGYLNVTTINEARNLPFTDLLRGTLLTIGNARPEGRYAVTPVVDNTFIPDLPSELFDSGRYHHGLRILVGHNAMEGLYFTNPNATDDSSFRLWMKDVFPSASDNALSDLLAHYPSTFDGSLPYQSPAFRAAEAIGDSTLNAHAWRLASLEGNEASFAYLYNVSPALHILDLFHTFYTPEAPTSRFVVNVTTARAMQKGIASFVQHGTPDFGLGALDVYGTEGRTLNISTNDLVLGVDPALNERNKWWYSTGYKALAN